MKGLLHVGLLLFLSASVCHGQAMSFFEKIKTEDFEDVYLKLDWKNLQHHKDEKNYVEGQLGFHPEGMDTVIVDAKIKTRGNMRLNICGNPPLKLKMSKKDLGKAGMSDINEVEIVQPCQDAELYNQYILREYLAYKLWELICPYHYRTKLFRLHYVDMDDKEWDKPTIAIFKEHPEELLERLQGKETKMEVINTSALEKQEFLLTCLFEFMIGNTDWFVATRHNLDFFGIPGCKLLTVIPYDFDYSGLVNANYAAPHESLKFTSVGVRYYQGKCCEEVEVEKQLKVFLDHKAEILSLPAAIPGLDEKSVTYTTNYLSGFFEIIENPKKLKSQILQHCDLWPVPN